MTTPLAESEVLHACRTLFGPGSDIGRGFLYYLQPSGAKSAYRKKAKETHPDFFYAEDSSIQQQQTATFRAIMEAYDIINRFFKERDNGLWTVSPDTTGKPARRGSHQARPATRSAGKQSGGYHYRGQIPFCVLELGRYLFYSGHISYGELIEALIWQRLQRPIIGNVALRWGWLAERAIEQITASSAIPGRFGEKAVRLGLLSDFQVGTLLYYQRSQQERLGNYFILNKILTADQLDHLVQKLHEHNAQVRASENAARRCNIFGEHYWQGFRRP